MGDQNSLGLLDRISLGVSKKSKPDSDTKSCGTEEHIYISGCDTARKSDEERDAVMSSKHTLRNRAKSIGS